MIFHPSESRLNEFADGELSRRPRIRTAAHLEGCSRCRNTIVAIRHLSREARVLPEPRVPAGLKDRILERLANGEQVILPVADPARPAMPRRRLAGAFAATVAIAIAASIITAPALESESSQLIYFPQTPEMGQELSIEYRSTSMFSGEKTLVLRGVLRTEELDNTWHDDVPSVTVATLVRKEDGVYRTTFRLPEDVVYAVLAVEDVHAQQVDARGLQFWEVLAHEDGTPTYAALMQKYHDLLLRNWEAARQTAQGITELYPDKPGGWAVLSALEYQFYGPSGFALLREPDHLGEFERLERLLERSHEYSHDDVANMYFYAGVLGDSAGSRRWGDRLLQEAPGHRTAKEIRVSDIVRQAAAGAPLASVLEQFENLWEERGLVSTMPKEAFRIALQTDDIDAMGKWLDRLEQAWPSTIDARATEFAVATAGREAGVQRIRSLLVRLEDPAQVNRSLYRTANEHSRHSALRRQALAGVLAQVLIEQGAITDGLGYLIPALDGGWNVPLFSRAAEIRLSLADTTEAFEVLARLAVDPWTDRSVVDSIGTEARKAVGADRWQTMLENARDAMTAYFLEDLSPQRRIKSDIVVHDNAGTPHTIDEVMRGKITVLAFWSQYDFFAVDELERLGEASRRVEALDGKVIAFVREPPSSEWDEFAQSKHLQFPVYHDVGSALVRELDVWGYQYFVVDGSGMVRFSYTDLDRALNQVAALRHLEKAATLVSEEGDRLP